MARARRLLAMLLLIFWCLGLSSCVAPAYAFVAAEQPETPAGLDEPGQTQLDDLRDWNDPNALTPEGNLTLVDDVQTFGSSEKEFLTVQTKSGNYFYIIIERDGDKANVHFLNQVDESDLLALLEDGPRESQTPVCTCKGRDKCFVGSVNTACEVCAVDMQSCLGNEPPLPGPEEEKSANPALAVGALLLLLAMAGAGGLYLYRSIMLKKTAKQQAPDFDEGYEDDYPEEENDGEEEETDEIDETEENAASGEDEVIKET